MDTLIKGQKIQVIAVEPDELVETTGADHWDGTGFLSPGLLATYGPNELHYFAQQYDCWDLSTDMGGYCVESKDYRYLRGNVFIEFECVVEDGPMAGWIEGYYTSTKGLRTLVRIPSNMIAKDSANGV